MLFQLGTMVNVVSDVEKIVSLFMTYNGETHSIDFDHDALLTPESAKEVLTTTVGALLDIYIASKE